MITARELSALLTYDRESGEFRWRRDRRVGNGGTLLVTRAGAIAGTVNGKGYRVIAIDGRDYRAHRLAWLYVTGSHLSPLRQIDHRDGERDNNRWLNLRAATNAQNSQNEKRARRSSSTGFLGVSRHRYGFRARIAKDGREFSLGVHRTAHAAHLAYVRAKRNIHPFGTL